MIQLCLFDLDQTLVDTADMKDLREAGKHRQDAQYPGEVRAAFRQRNRSLIDEAALTALQSSIQGLKLGIFTRSPRRYVDVILAEAFGNTNWSVVIAYEDVQNYKPNGEGIHRAMTAVGMGNSDELPNVLMVGDGDVDIRAAYHAGCRVALFKKGWPRTYDRSHWRSLGLLPDFVLDDQDDLLALAPEPRPGLPELEKLLDGGMQVPPGHPRFDEIGKFFPNDRTRHIVQTSGRYFPFYETLNYRRGWHQLSHSIQANKDAVAFPAEWVEALRRYIAFQYYFLTAMPTFGGNGPEIVITAVPARPGRVHRLGNLIAQLQASYGNHPTLNRLRLSFDAGVLAYRPGVQSQSHDHLTQEQRFANVRDHLYVVNPAAAQGKKFLVIDDVSTSGATLLYAKKYLLDAHANTVDLFSLAQTVSDPLRYQ